MVLRSTSYKLRASAPQPKTGVCLDPLLNPNPPVIGFVLQTFLAEKSITDTCEDQSQLLCSNDMLGLGGNYISASYSAQRFIDPSTGGIVFNSQETKQPTFIAEDEIPGVGTMFG